MIIVRMYRMLSEIVIEGSALIDKTPNGFPCEPQSFFIGRQYADAASSVGAEELSTALYNMITLIDEELASERGGPQGLL